ncbi:MAG: PstS family phosphate ABC transporter substrate-binding protein [Candidatus Omnitrophica bacterium]|nr:PstS family phosphate ABC transporter substrate-binding protein [Candidatus Omnitrophota bacterium]
MEYMKKTLFVLFLLLFSPIVCAEDINIKGSDTIVRLTQRLAEVYMKDHPQVKIAVSGGGSGVGIAAIINQTADIADASREMKAKELEGAARKNVSPKKVVIAADAIAIIVNERNPVRTLTTDELGAVFRGEITNWKKLGGLDMPVTLYGRQSTSGTYVFLRDLVVKADYSPRMAGLQGNAGIMEAVKADQSGIGFVGVAFIRKAEGVSPLMIAASKDHPYLSPLDKDVVESGAYPLTRPLIQYIDAHSRPEVHGFIAFELSSDGQKVIEEEGFFQIPLSWKTRLH